MGSGRLQAKDLHIWKALMGVYNNDRNGIHSVNTEQVYIYVNEKFYAHFPRRVVLAKLKKLRRQGYLEAGGFVGKIYDPTQWSLTMLGAGECRRAMHRSPRLLSLVIEAKNA